MPTGTDPFGSDVRGGDPSESVGGAWSGPGATLTLRVETSRRPPLSAFNGPPLAGQALATGMATPAGSSDQSGASRRSPAALSEHLLSRQRQRRLAASGGCARTCGDVRHWPTSPAHQKQVDRGRLFTDGAPDRQDPESAAVMGPPTCLPGSKSRSDRFHRGTWTLARISPPILHPCHRDLCRSPISGRANAWCSHLLRRRRVAYTDGDDYDVRMLAFAGHGPGCWPEPRSTGMVQQLK